MVTVERPLYLIFLLIAGALWDPTAWQGWVLAPVFVFARVSGKVMGGYVAKYFGPAELPDAGTLGLALSPQSPIAIAIIVSYATLYKSQTGDSTNMPWLMTACIGSAVITELTVQTIVRLRGGLRFDMRGSSMSSYAPWDDAASPAPGVVMPGPMPVPRFPSEPPGGSS
jgi:hypothetical protein